MSSLIWKPRPTNAPRMSPSNGLRTNCGASVRSSRTPAPFASSSSIGAASAAPQSKAKLAPNAFAYRLITASFASRAKAPVAATKPQTKPAAASFARDGRVAVLVVDEPEVRDREQAECDDPADERAAIGGRRDRDLARQDERAGDDEQAVDPEGQVVRLEEAEVLAPPGLLDRAAAVLGERAHDAARMLRIIATMSSRRRDIAPFGPETTISTPSPSPAAGLPRDLNTNATIDPCLRRRRSPPPRRRRPGAS